MSTLAKMAESAGRVLEGIFAVNKPPHLSSAQVLRDLQRTFAKSKTFAPLLAQTEASREEHRSKRRRIDKENVFKMGHGGTLDPMATGILIVGIGRGTKGLPAFLDCKKTYETVILFGQGTDTYDVAGKVVCQAPYNHITRQLVEEKLEAFRGRIKQTPPIYSALKFDGMKSYEYARAGKELPRELPSRDMVVDDCTLMEWFDGGQHDFKWPAEEAETEDKVVLQKLIPGVNPEGETKSTVENHGEPTPEEPSSANLSEKVGSTTEEKKALHTHDIQTLSELPADAPAVRIRLTVSSGFYVRSFAHDLGIACKSYSTMAELERSQQADFTTSNPPPDGMSTALTLEELEGGEDVWGPPITAMLEKWSADNPVEDKGTKIDDRDRHKSTTSKKHRSHKGFLGHDRKWRKVDENPRRNSSSPD